MNKAKTLIVFFIGTVIGSIAGWQGTKRYYGKFAQEKIDAVKEHYSRKSSGKVATYVKDTIKEDDVIELCDKSVEEIIDDEEEERAYRDLVNDSGYVDYSDVSTKDPDSHVKKDKPYVISPDDFGEMKYEEVSLTYYADKILTDEDDEIVDDVEETVGFDSLSHFGEYEDDSVHVRNDRLKIDYEILLDPRRYSEVLKTKPRLPEV